MAGDDREGARGLSRRTFIGAGLGFAAWAVTGCHRRAHDGANVIVICLDDMRRDGLQFLPKARALLTHEFTQARANGGACTDTRLGLFTGTWTRNHPWSWWQTAGRHDPARAWGAWVQGAGYRTGMFGKYITVDVWRPGAEPGWDVWRSYWADAHHEWGVQLDEGDRIVTPAVGNLGYLTDQLVEFVTTSSGPFFASWNPQHPHTVTETGALHPLPEHAEAYADLVWPVPLDAPPTCPSPRPTSPPP